MKINVTFRHMEATEALKSHVIEKMEKFEKYLVAPMEAHVILSVEKFRQQCEITLSASHFHAQALETSGDLYASIDTAVHRIDRQVKKHKEIMKNRKDNVPIHSAVAESEEEFSI